MNAKQQYKLAYHQYRVVEYCARHDMDGASHLRFVAAVRRFNSMDVVIGDAAIDSYRARKESIAKAHGIDGAAV